MESFVYDHKLNGERFDLFCFVCSVFVIVLHSLSLSFVITYFSFFFSRVKKREQLSLILYLGLLGNSREILSAAVLDSTLMQSL